MPTDLEQIELIRSQTLQLLADLQASPEPSYSLNGNQYSWTEYQAELKTTIDWCDRKLGEYDPFEVHSRGES